MTTAHAVFTDEMLDRERAKIGIEMTPKEPYFNTVATRDAIRHFADGIGDLNPLWRDPDYTRGTKYGCIIAPPCFLYTVCRAPASLGLPGIHSWHSGNDWYFYKPILVNDEFTYSWALTKLIEKTKSQVANRIFLQYHDILYRNQHDELVAKQVRWATRVERRSAGEKGKNRDIPKAEYTAEDIQHIYADYDREEIRGSTPRYWEDVQVGDELIPVVKGPLSMRDLIAYAIGAGAPFMKAHGAFLTFSRRHKGFAMLDSQTGAEDVPELVHQEVTRAQEIGIAGAYDYGSQRISWVGHLLTNWMGDEGTLKNLYAELRRFNLVGYTTWAKGRVTRKYAENGEHLVDIECWAENQFHEVTLPGHATVSLPSRG